MRDRRTALRSEQNLFLNQPGNVITVIINVIIIIIINVITRPTLRPLHCCGNKDHKITTSSPKI